MLDNLKNPQNNYKPTATWFWNDKPDDNGDCNTPKFKEMHSKGIGGFIIRPESEDIKATVGPKLVAVFIIMQDKLH